jgi:hypothetical protein
VNFKIKIENKMEFSSETFDDINFELSEDDLNSSDRLDTDIQMKAFEYLQYLSVQSTFECLVNDNKAINAIKFTYVNSIRVKTFDLAYKSFFKNFPEIIIKLLEYLSSTFNANEHVKTLEMALSIVYNFSLKSITFCKYFHEKNGIVTMFSFLSNKELIENILNSENVEEEKEKEKNSGKNIVADLIDSLVQLSEVSSDFVQLWHNVNAVQSLIKFSQFLMEKSIDLRLDAYMAIANIANDKEIDTLPGLQFILKEIVDKISLYSQLMTFPPLSEDEDKSSLPFYIKKSLVEMEEYQGELKEISVIVYSDNKTEWNIVELLKALYHLSINDSIKFEIYFSLEIRKHLNAIILHGNEIEQEFAMQLLGQLCFNKRIIQDVASEENNQIYEKIHQIINENKSDEDEGSINLLRNTSSVLWLIDQYKKELTLQQEGPSLLGMRRTKQPKHIMISYNSKSRDTCLNIKEQLEKLNHQVWIDVENIHGSSLEAMADAIEESTIVLMCMTEKYKQSVNCRAEAEYAFQCKRPIIPLIMQKDYMPDGWYNIKNYHLKDINNF